MRRCPSYQPRAVLGPASGCASPPAVLSHPTARWTAGPARNRTPPFGGRLGCRGPQGWHMPKSGTSFAAASMFALRSASSAASAAAARAYARGLPTRKARSAEVATALQWRRRRLLILRSRRLYRASPAYSERPARAPPSARLRQRASPTLVPMEAMTRATSERRRRGGRGSAAGLPRHLPYTPLYGMGAGVPPCARLCGTGAGVLPQRLLWCSYHHTTWHSC